MILLALALQPGLANVFLDLIQLADQRQRLGGGFRLGGLRLEEAAAGMRPALGMSDPGLRRVVGIGVVAIRQQHRPLGRRQPQRRLDVLDLAALEEGKTDLVAFPMDWPEIASLQLPGHALSGLDRRFIHCLDPGLANRRPLRLVDRLEQGRPLLGDRRQPRPAEGEARVGKALVLAIQRQVVGELVDQQAGNEAHVRPAAVDDVARRRRADERFAGLELHHRPAILDHDVTPGALCETVAFLVADDLVVFGREALGCRCGQFDDLDRHLGLVEERHGIAVIRALGRRFAGVRGNQPAWGFRQRRLSQPLAQTHLAVRTDLDAAFALLAEELALEPVELLFEGDDFAVQGVVQVEDLLRGQARGFFESQNALDCRRLHAGIIPRQEVSSPCFNVILSAMSGVSGRR
ncbi:MAG: hypothetical protein AW08_03247 [Candidatus Accumulibacter adjunctus]|uniref:Uncharacterized protein n=1 Tax=Candidatus Accumulibacter adjunctus TaxID=1454001 RepID=A0A011M6S2_9PROT|nr:MAG: hypothetical protein AW08_03247 [Candidatus Accumulibacter adjunctus]